MLLNPVSLFRYLEFDFCARAAENLTLQWVLDVSSPRLFSAYMIARNPGMKIRIINPDPSDIAETKNLFGRWRVLTPSVEIQCQYASDINDEPESFDLVYSISVVEHVLDDQERDFLLSLWNLVKPGGSLVLTVPVAAQHQEEYRRSDTYSLGYPRNSRGDVFFQRCYSASSLRSRIFGALNRVPTEVEVWGTSKWYYEDYVHRWRRCGLGETCKDAYYVSKYVKRFTQIDSLPERGICCMAFIR